MQIPQTRRRLHHGAQSGRTTCQHTKAITATKGQFSSLPRMLQSSATCFWRPSLLVQQRPIAGLPLLQKGLIALRREQFFDRGQPLLLDLLFLFQTEGLLITVIKLRLVQERIGGPKNFAKLLWRRLENAQFIAEIVSVMRIAEQELLHL